ncbi:MAG: LEPR-XLL domain-containing protein, partial [candidate division NC10 bacterium]|nr:LEPR-XLL domain-containing protein [candidate division NC10 bacterium]
MSLIKKLRKSRNHGGNRGNGKGRNPVRKFPSRRNKFLLEPLEPRLLLSSDLSYTAPAAANLTLRLDDATQELQLLDNSSQSILQSQALADTSLVVIAGSEEKDIFTLDFRSPFSVPITLDGKKGSDTLRVLGEDQTWEITGTNAGEVASIDFSSIENLTGAPNNQDTFIFEPTGKLSGKIRGGAGGFDSLLIEGGSYNTVIFTPTGPDSGSVSLDGKIISYLGLEPITLSGAPDNVTLDGSSADNNILVDLDGGNIRVSAVGTMESHSFAAPANSLTIKGGAGYDSVTVAANLNIPGADLAISAESITVNSGITVTADDISLTAADAGTTGFGNLLDTLLELVFDDSEAFVGSASATVDLTGASLVGNDITVSASSTMSLTNDGTALGTSLTV